VNDDLRRRIPHLIALARVTFGLGLMAAPVAGAGPYLGAEAKRPSVRFMNRIFGSRELALGVVLLQALRDDRPEAATQALLLGAGCDAWDAIAALRSRELPIWSRLMVATLGSTFAALGASAAFAPPVDPDELATAAPAA
jgi:hypothetical protein